ncbi:hypothetical protein [Mycobacterium sp. IDR2000157661]|uniref:hypothetical protein n=1 Tax=Mycobacterium sp. IDR2000157661 TaxID=2867005 RepID=UPI001EE9FC0F|nr:hypothetical protein [Mycobacterium sp. IDR2000157661]ULE32357.1 hypothetical protein K3G64_19840 [Mycobacterium sp. IDR2000157661]
MTGTADSARGGHWLRSRPSRGLLLATLLISLALGVAVVMVEGAETQTWSGAPLSDDEAAAQVVAAARQIVSAAQLQQTAGGYSFQPCTTTGNPPYQVTMYATFAVPERNPARYLDGVADAMSADGWARSPVVGERFGAKLSSDGVVALINRDATDSGHATLRLYGECRNWGAHRDDDPAWTEIDF